MAKKVNNKKKIESLKAKRNAHLFGAGISGLYGGYKGYKLGEVASMGNQLKESSEVISGLTDKIRRREPLTEVEERALHHMSNKPIDFREKLIGAIYQSPRTQKARLKGGLIGGTILASPNLIGAISNQIKINKLKKKLREEEEEVRSFSKDDDSKDYVVPSDDKIMDMSRLQVLRILDKRDKQVDKDRKNYIKKKTKRGGIWGSVLGAGLGSLAGYLGNKYLLENTDKKSMISNSILSGISAGALGYNFGSKIGKNNAEEYVKDADEFNNLKVTRKLAKRLDKIMREQGRNDDLEVLNEEKFRNKKDLENSLKRNSVLNLGRNEVKVYK